MTTMDLRARVTCDGVEYYLGKFTTPEAARSEEMRFRVEMGFPLTAGEKAMKGLHRRKERGICC